MVVSCASLLAMPAQSFGQQKPGQSKQQGVLFNFIDVELSSVAKFVSDVTGKNFIFDDRLKGKITIIAPARLSAEDAYSLFSSVLKMKGFTIVPAGVDAYKIVPIGEVRQSGVEVSEARSVPGDENYVARLIPLKNITSEDGQKFLQQVVSKDGFIASFGPGNMLLVIDSALNVETVMKILEGIDRPPVSEEPEVVALKYAGADAVAKVLNEGIEKRAQRGGAPAGDRAVADARLNAVVLFGSSAAKQTMKRLISMLDISPADKQGAINVYFLENADSEELAKVIDTLKTRVAQRPGGAQAGGAGVFESVGSISITADKASNALLIAASPADYSSIIGVIKQLDRRPRQVYVEALIVEASLDKLKELGSRWRATATHNGEPVVIGGVGTVDSSTMGNIMGGLSGLTVGGVGNFVTVPVTGEDGTTRNLTVPGFAALFSLGEFVGAVNILSSPQILTSDNIEAEIVVGENVPFVSKRERDVTTTNTVLSSIERKDVGIILRIKPQIAEGDYVKLDIFQEISSVKESSEAVGPTTAKRSTKTSIVVQDGQTVVIGGLMQEREEVIEQRVPLLHRIPILGWLFKFKSNQKQKTNLLVFINPNVIKDAETIKAITMSKQDTFARDEQMYAEGELLIKFNEGVAPEAAEKIIADMEATVMRVYSDLNLYFVKLKEGEDVMETIEDLKDVPEVKYSEPNYRIGTRGGVN